MLVLDGIGNLHSMVKTTMFTDYLGIVGTT